MFLKKMRSNLYLVKCRKRLFQLLIGLSVSATSVQSHAISETTLWRTGMGATVAALYMTNALDADIMTVDTGVGNNVYFLRYNARWLSDSTYQFGKYLSIQPSLQFGYSKWQSEIDPDRSATNNVIDLVPIFRWSGRWLPLFDFMDTGLGLSIFSADEISGHKFGGPLQFNDYIGFGWNFGEQQNWEFSFRFQHYSNNDIYADNNGINLPHISIGYDY